MIPTITDTGSNYLSVDLGDVVLHFSYRTVIAFWSRGRGLVVSENQWGPTTGKHLSRLDNGNKGARLDRAEFERQLSIAIAVLGVAA